jgi:hypothetical protein
MPNQQRGSLMRTARHGWVMPEEEDARSMLRLIEKRIKSSDIQVQHRDVLIRLRAMIEDDLSSPEWSQSKMPPHQPHSEPD